VNEGEPIFFTLERGYTYVSVWRFKHS